MAEVFCKDPGCPKPGPYKNSRALGNHRSSKVHQGQKSCDVCGEEYGYSGPHEKTCKGPDAAKELHWDTAELKDRTYWEDRALKAEETAARRLRNDRKLRKALRAAGKPLPKDLEKQ